MGVCPHSLSRTKEPQMWGVTQGTEALGERKNTKIQTQVQVQILVQILVKAPYFIHPKGREEERSSWEITRLGMCAELHGACTGDQSKERLIRASVVRASRYPVLFPSTMAGTSEQSHGESPPSPQG